jgi:hypothetical protein
MWNISYWVDRLEDPFEMFPMQAAMGSLASLADEQEKRRFDRAGPWGIPSPKYYTVEDEHDIEVVGHLVGSAFVLGQATITQGVSLVKRMHEEAGKPSWIPSGKNEILKTAAPIHPETGLSKITITNAVANYYKHRYEWWDDWSGPPNSKTTIDIVVQLGLGPKGYHNLEHALRELGMNPDDMAPLAQLVVTWREQLAEYIRAQGKKNGVPIASRFPESDTPE